MKRKLVYIAIVLFALMSGVFTSCHKESDSAPKSNPLKGQIQAFSSAGHTAKLQHQLICPYGGGYYHLDLDDDGTPDLALRLWNFEDDQIECQDCYYRHDYNLGCDTILCNNIYISCQVNFGWGNRYYLGDTMQFSTVAPHASWNGCGLMMAWTKQSCDFTSNGIYCDTTAQYFGFEKVDAKGTRYGWFALQYDSQFNVYLDGVYMSRIYDRHIRAGFED